MSRTLITDFFGGVRSVREQKKVSELKSIPLIQKSNRWKRQSKNEYTTKNNNNSVMREIKNFDKYSKLVDLGKYGLILLGTIIVWKYLLKI